MLFRFSVDSFHRSYLFVAKVASKYMIVLLVSLKDFRYFVNIECLEGLTCFIQARNWQTNVQNEGQSSFPALTFLA